MVNKFYHVQHKHNPQIPLLTNQLPKILRENSELVS